MDGIGNPAAWQKGHRWLESEKKLDIDHHSGIQLQVDSCKIYYLSDII
jgi:hypothetical protein